MHVKQLNLVEQTCTLFVNYPNTHIPTTINDCDNISICFVLFAMNPLKSGLGNLCLTIVLFNFVHIIYRVSMPSNFMSQTVMVMICNMSYHMHGKPLLSN